MDDKDANEGITEEACQNGGGSYELYSCGDANEYLGNEAKFELDQDFMDFLINDWWKPKCCAGDVSEKSSEDESSDIASLEVEPEPEAIDSAAALGFASSPNFIL